MTAAPETPHSDSGMTGDQDSSGRAWFDAFRWTEQRDWSDAIILVVVLATFWLLGGGWGVIAWVVVTSCWFVFPPIVPVALGQFALLALLPSDGGFGTVFPGTIALLALLVSDIVTEMQDLPDGLFFVGSAVILSGVVLGLAWTTGLVAAVIGAVVILATVSYLLHRVLLFKLGHLTAAPE